MHPPVVASATANKCRTITLTNPPIRIHRECLANRCPGHVWQPAWSIEIRVRKDAPAVDACFASLPPVEV
jgi:hypothetical protein